MTKTAKKKVVRKRAVQNTLLPGQLEIDHNRGVIYFHTSSPEMVEQIKSVTVLRLQGLPPLKKTFSTPIDLNFESHGMWDELSMEEREQFKKAVKNRNRRGR